MNDIEKAQALQFIDKEYERLLLALENEMIKRKLIDKPEIEDSK